MRRHTLFLIVGCAFALGLYALLGWQGAVGCIIGGLISEFVWSARYGTWFDDGR